MARVRNPIRMAFRGGPMDRQLVDMLWIPDVNMMLSERDRVIYAYLRDETIYTYDEGLSARLTAIYDQVKGRFKRNPVMPVGEMKEDA